jgi:hypothetical protein
LPQATAKCTCHSLPKSPPFEKIQVHKYWYIKKLIKLPHVPKIVPKIEKCVSKIVLKTSQNLA